MVGLPLKSQKVENDMLRHKECNGRGIHMMESRKKNRWSTWRSVSPLNVPISDDISSQRGGTKFRYALGTTTSY